MESIALTRSRYARCVEGKEKTNQAYAAKYGIGFDLKEVHDAEGSFVGFEELRMVEQEEMLSINQVPVTQKYWEDVMFYRRLGLDWICPRIYDIHLEECNGTDISFMDWLRENKSKYKNWKL